MLVMCLNGCMLHVVLCAMLTCMVAVNVVHVCVHHMNIWWCIVCYVLLYLVMYSLLCAYIPGGVCCRTRTEHVSAQSKG